MATQLPNDISLNGLNATRGEEGRALRAYQDSVGVWTVGYGLTNFDRGLPWRIKQGLVITEAQAEWYLLKSIRSNYLPDVHRALEGGTYAHPQGAVDGALDFHFNCGGILKATWPRLLGRGQMAAAETSMKSWNKAGGRVLSDLVRRRARDWEMVSAGTYGHLTGPLVVEPNAHNRETYHGYGDLLTAYPTQSDGSAGTVAEPPPDNVDRPPASHPGALRLGDVGVEVTQLQTRLNSAGFPASITGTFDSDTESAVRQFQGYHPNLTVDGIVGPATDATLDRAINLRSAVAATAKVATPGVPGTYIAAHQWLSAHAGNVALGVGLAVVAGVAIYLAWTYRHDVAAALNRWRGKVVP